MRVAMGNFFTQRLILQFHTDQFVYKATYSQQTVMKIFKQFLYFGIKFQRLWRRPFHVLLIRGAKTRRMKSSTK